MLGRGVSRSVAQSAAENYRSECKYGSVVRSSVEKCLEECCIIMLELLQRSVAGDLGESRVVSRVVLSVGVLEKRGCREVTGKSAAEKSRYVVEK